MLSRRWSRWAPPIVGWSRSVDAAPTITVRSLSSWCASTATVDSSAARAGSGRRSMTDIPRERARPRGLTSRFLDVVVEVELPRVGAEADLVDLALTLVGDPRLDEVGRE